MEPRYAVTIIPTGNVPVTEVDQLTQIYDSKPSVTCVASFIIIEDRSTDTKIILNKDTVEKVIVEKVKKTEEPGDKVERLTRELVKAAKEAGVEAGDRSKFQKVARPALRDDEEEL